MILYSPHVDGAALWANYAPAAQQPSFRAGRLAPKTPRPPLAPPGDRGLNKPVSSSPEEAPGWKPRVPTQWKEDKTPPPAETKPEKPKETPQPSAPKEKSTKPPEEKTVQETPPPAPAPPAGQPWGKDHDILDTLKKPAALEKSAAPTPAPAEAAPSAAPLTPSAAAVDEGLSPSAATTGEGLSPSASAAGDAALSPSGDLSGSLTTDEIGEMPLAITFSSVVESFSIGFTGEFTTLLTDTQVTGDANKSFEPEQRYLDENISIRGVGGFGDFNEDGEQPGQVVAGFGANHSTKLNEPSWLIDRVNLGFITKQYTLDLWNILPKFTDYTFNSKKLEGASLLLNNRKTSLLLLFGRDNQLSKATGIHRAHYGAQFKKVNPAKERTFAVQWMYTYDDRPSLGAAFTEKNSVASFSFEGGTKKFYKWDGEYVKSWTNHLGPGDAYLFNLKKKKANYLFKGGYEYTDLNFDTLGGNATPGKKESKASLKWVFSKRMDITVGYKDRDFFNNRTEEVPIIFNLVPLPAARPKMKVAYKFTDKSLKSTGDKLNVNMNDIQVQDDMGIHRVKLKYLDETRDKLKAPNQDKRQWEFSADTDMSDALTIKSKFKRFGQKTLSRFNESSINFSYSLDEWSDASLQYSFKDTQGARSDKENWTFGYTTLDIENDREYAFKFKRDGFRDFTVNTFEFKLGMVY